MISRFSVNRRDVGHWDILGVDGRAFKIRGEPGNYMAMDERERPYPVTKFKTMTAAMSFICDELMMEPES